jgi:predicted ATPase/class 3 adenylate cyclase
MRCPNCQTVNPPEAKFCLECGNRLVVCPSCGTVNVPLAKFCIECGTALKPKGESTHPLPALSPEEPQIQTTANSNGKLTLPEERRVVTIMFADIIGSTPLADRLDPEDMRAILAGYFNLMTEQIRRHGGTVEKYIGDAVMAVFGIPVTHEDDPDRAIRAALDMQKALTDFNRRRQAQDSEATQLQMRIGINTGEVVAPGNDVANRYDFLITGDAVNVAARLQQVAAPDTILVGERTYLATRGVFDFCPIAPLRLKGKAEPIAAWVVLDLHKHTSTITQHPRGIEGLQAPLVGRMLELTLMHATYARVQAEKHPHLITLLGAPGIGKTRLVREFIAREREAAKSASSNSELAVPRVLEGRCPPYGEGITYWPLVEILRSLLRIQDKEGGAALAVRFREFVRDTLIKARRAEDPERIASDIARSIGRGFSSSTDEQSHPGRSERDLYRTDDLGKVASVLASGTGILSSSIGRGPGSTVDEPGYLDRREWEHQRNKYSKEAEQSNPRIALMRAWRVLLEALAQQEPLILVIDDLQWADEALLDLLEYLTDRVTDVPVLFLCPARPDLLERRRDWGGGRRNFTTIALEVLSKEETGELLSALLDTDELPEVLHQTIQRRAEGNPFFVEEIVRMLIDQKLLVYKEGYWRISTQKEALLSELANPSGLPEDTLLDQHYILPLTRIPDTIQGVLAARIDLLSPIEKLVLQHASIIGRTFWLAALVELAGRLDPATLLKTLDTLVKGDFIIEIEKSGLSPVEHDRVFSFKHILIRDVVYNNIPRIRRSYEHTRLALWLEKQVGDNDKDFVELLAYHYQQALVTWSPSLLASSVTPADTPDATGTRVRLTRPELRSRTITYLGKAGDQALECYYTIRAIQAYSEALDLLAASEADSLTLARMHEKLGDAYYQRTDIDKALKEYRKALELEMETEPQENNGTRLRLYDRLAELSTRWTGLKDTIDIQEARCYIDAGLKLLEDRRASGEYAAFLTYQAFWYIRQVDIVDSDRRAELAEQALQSEQEALRIAEKLDDVDSLWLTLDALGFIFNYQRKYSESHKAQHYRLTLADKITSREELHDLYQALGWAHIHVCDYATAATWFGRSWAIAQTMESPSLLLRSLIGRMAVWYEWGRWSDAEEAAQNVLQIIEQYQQSERWQPYALVPLAVIAYQTGDQEQGDDYTRQYKRLIDRYGPNSELIALEPFLFLAREDWTRAFTDFKEKLERSEPFPPLDVLTQLAEIAVITGENVEEQRALCERAIAVTEQSGNRKSFANALRARGRMYLEQENWSAAEQDLQQALQICEELDIRWERGQTLYCLGLYYRRRADVLSKENVGVHAADMGRAHRHFEQALGFFESLKAIRDVERTRVALAQDSNARV